MAANKYNIPRSLVNSHDRQKVDLALFFSNVTYLNTLPVLNFQILNVVLSNYRCAYQC